MSSGSGGRRESNGRNKPKDPCLGKVALGKTRHDHDFDDHDFHDFDDHDYYDFDDHDFDDHHDHHDHDFDDDHDYREKCSG